MISIISQFVLVFAMFVLIHNITVSLYSHFCAPFSFLGFFNSFFMIPTPQCRILLNAVNYTADSYVTGAYAISTLGFKYLCDHYRCITDFFSNDNKK